MKGYSSLPVLVLLSCFICINSIHADFDPSLVRLEDGKLHMRLCDKDEVLPVSGIVEKMDITSTGIYYISRYDNRIAVGYIEKGSGKKTEKELPEDIKGFAPEKMTARNGIVYVLCIDKDNGIGAGRVLVRIGLNDMAVSTRKGVEDFAFTGENPIIIEKREEMLCVNYNGQDFPLIGKGTCSIGRVIDDRVLFVTCSGDTEIIDLKLQKSIYHFSPDKSYAEAGEYNVVINAIDIINSGQGVTDEKMTFYKVFINGVYAGRTESAPGGATREFKYEVETEKYCMLRLERWDLDNRKKQYKRANNVLQPEPSRLFIPQKRIVKIDVTFNGTEYKMTSRILEQ